MLESEFFKQIYLDLAMLIQDEKQRRSKAKENFESLNNYLLLDNLNSIPKAQRDSILKVIKNRDSIKNEFGFMKRYFKKENVDTKDVENNLLLMLINIKFRIIFHLLFSF